MKAAGSLGDRLAGAVAGSALAPGLVRAAAPFLARRSGDAAAARLPGPVLAGLARVLATRPVDAAFLAHRPALLERIAALTANSLEARGRELLADPGELDPGDLEAALDALRLLRREETLIAACVDFGGLADFDDVSGFLSILAEAVLARSLRLAEATLPEAAARARLSVIGMGKIAGREFTYHSDLDLIFLAEGDTAELADAARIGQRLISYLTTMTGAGTAYAVDTRLRPSGQQGALVTTRESFERYQCEQAELWEHMALLRARAVAGHRGPAQTSLDRVRGRLLARRRDPWPYVAELRQRVVRERSDPSPQEVHFKTGRGGLMDVEFLASGGMLERGGSFPRLPSVPGMLGAAVTGPRLPPLLRDYHFLRRVESRVRWVAGRAVEAFRASGESLAASAELVCPGLPGPALLEQVAATRARIRRAYDAVVAGGSITALEAR